MPSSSASLRILVHGRARDDVLAEARALGLLGWVRDAPGGGVLVHAEGAPEAVAALAAALGDDAERSPSRVEGHEQLAVRGVPAGRFVVREHHATARHFDLRLEVGGVARSWAVPKEPSMDPAVKRLAVEVPDHALSHLDVPDAWDRGPYEQGGRVAWPEALERGHAVFVLHGERLSGGFVLQRTRGRGEGAQWLLLKRRD